MHINASANATDIIIIIIIIIVAALKNVKALARQRLQRSKCEETSLLKLML
jgi:hypothetical protein